jgi:hypothetical protein
MRSRALLQSIAAAIADSTLLTAQEQEPAAPRYRVEAERLSDIESGDYREERLFGGFRFTIPSMKLEVRGNNALLLLDIEAAHAMFASPSTTGLPRRGIDMPAPRRRLSPEELRTRLERTMQAVGQDVSAPEDGSADRALDLVRYIYFEGGITVVRDGVEVIRCDRLWISPLDDRIVVENAEIRYQTGTKATSSTLVVRGPRLVKSGGRWTGRDLTITTCTAGEPHVALASGEVEIIERPGEFEVISRGQSLQIGGTNLMPLPDAHFFTASQSEFPIRRVRGGYSSTEGFEAEVLLGTTWNGTGGALHHAITGRPASEFRGEWELGLGWIQERGEPISGAVEYRVDGLYEGRTDVYGLDDSGKNIREVVRNLDGSLINDTGRGLFRTQNRVRLGTDTHLDLTAFAATDPAVLPEFFGGDYRSKELPETSAYLHHSSGSHLFTVGTRHNLDDFSYRDNRALANRFVEEEPVVTWNWIAQPIAETPWETPVVLDVAAEIGERRSKYDPLATATINDRTLRADQRIEISAPFHFAELNFRPYVAGSGTYYDQTVDGRDDARIAWEAGFEVGTRLSRSWHWTDEEGEQSLRHVIAPKITFADRFRVDDSPSEFYQFDATDALTEQNLIRFELRNLVQRMDPVDGTPQPRDFLMVDLAQDLWPNAGRDNQGDQLGLLYYDVIVRPKANWLPFDNFSFALYGDHDWNDGLRTLDTELRFGPLAGISWGADYRTDSEVQGAVGVSASTTLFGRWNAYARSLYDLDRDQFLTYGFGLRRNDHDWSIALNVGYNPFTEETSFRIEFEPRLGGISRRHEDRFGGSELHDTGLAARY